jgi:hypothetical protein
VDPKNQKLPKGVENLAYKMRSCSSCTAPYVIRAIKLRHILVSNVARIYKPDTGMKFFRQAERILSLGRVGYRLSNSMKWLYRNTCDCVDWIQLAQ